MTIIGFNVLLSSHGKVDLIPYIELLSTIEWFEKRKEVLERDLNRCTICGSKETSWNKQKDGSYRYYWLKLENRALRIEYTDRMICMHIHHKLYIKDLLPWEYEIENLITYCNWCHLDYHKHNKVSYFENINGRLIELSYTPCHRCNGAGWFPEYQKVQNGICFRCRGYKFEELIK